MVPAQLSLTGRRWILQRKDPISSIDMLVRTLAEERGIGSSLLDGVRETLSSPSLFPEMVMAVDRIHRAVKHKESVAIFGDYDADGITGTAQLVRYFRRHGIEPIAYLPHRMREGYGMKKASVDVLHARGATLIITVDTGIASGVEIEYAKKLGMDVIVTDHHHASHGRPDAYAVIHPLIPAAFPNPHLSGSGVAFMLVRALEQDVPWMGIREDFALAAIGTIADMVPLLGENRTLVMHGLRYINQLPPGPLKEFADAVRSQNGALTSTDIAFRLVPRINASGRMDDPAIALDALLQGGTSLAQLHTLNTQRQSLTKSLYDEARTSINLHDTFLCLQETSYTAGIVGLLAGKLTEAFGRPSLVAAKQGDISTASLRSIPQVHIMNILTHPSVQPLLLTFGGHAQAAGCTFRSHDFQTLKAALGHAMDALNIPSEDLVASMMIDAEILSDCLSPTLPSALAALEPFGQCNQEPRFLLRDIPLSALRTVGANGAHLQARIAGKKAVGFHLGAHLSTLAGKNTRADIACRFTQDTWNGASDLQIMIEDVRLHV